MSRESIFSRRNDSSAIRLTPAAEKSKPSVISSAFRGENNFVPSPLEHLAESGFREGPSVRREQYQMKLIPLSMAKCDTVISCMALTVLMAERGRSNRFRA